MARLTPEQLEQKIHAVLRDQPPRRAPGSLEARVLGEIARRRALPWWRQSYAFWPASVRLAFVGVGAAAAVCCVLAVFLGVTEVGTALMTGVVQPVSELVDSVRNIAALLGDLAGKILPTGHTTWIYVALALVGAAYAAILGLGATAYRLLWHRAV